MEAKICAERLTRIRQEIDKIQTQNLSRIKEILKRIYFCDIQNEYQSQENLGDLYKREFNMKRNHKEPSDYISNRTLDYTIQNGILGLAYGRLRIQEGETYFKSYTFDRYACFIADIIAEKIIFSSEIDSFVTVEGDKFTLFDEISFKANYAPNSKPKTIGDIYQVFTELFRDHPPFNHGYTIHPFSFVGKDWLFNVEDSTMIDRPECKKDLYFASYPIKWDDLNLEMPSKMLENVSENEASLHNAKLLHAYVLYRKLDLIPAEHFFILKDFGRSGKGLFMKTFQSIFKVHHVNFDALTSSSFEMANELVKLHGAELSHANETGAIDQKNMRVLRKLATNETISGRKIGKDSATFQNKSVLVLDTNERVDIGQLTANRSRAVKIAFKNRPKDETEGQRHEWFKPYWRFIAPDGETPRLEACLSFLIDSLTYLKKVKLFRFKEVTFRRYYDADQLTETQRNLLIGIQLQGFVLSADETLRANIKEDYGSMRTKKAKEDLTDIGVQWNAIERIDGVPCRVFKMGNKGKFQNALELLQDWKVQQGVQLT